MSNEQRQGRGEPGYLTPSDWAEIKRITTEIMSGISTADPAATESHIRGVLARAIVSANAEYDAKLADEATHKWEFGSHSISECRIDWCGRYRGQRRDSVAEAAQASDFLRVFALDNHASLSNNDLRQIEGIRTFLGRLLP